MQKWMKTLSGLNGKTMEEKLKRNWTVVEFAQHFETTEGEFLVVLKETFSEKAYKQMISRMKRNGKLARGRIR